MRSHMYMSCPGSHNAPAPSIQRVSLINAGVLLSYSTLGEKVTNW